MDTSKEYIKMCEEAEEIQIYGRDNFLKLRPVFVFDILLDRVSLAIWVPQAMQEKLNCGGDEVIVSIEQNRDKGVYLEKQPGEVIWLPRQDQLQEMLDCETYELLDMCSESDGIMWQALHDYASSMEQLWLAFVMKEKYNKTWDKDKWLKT